ncbi:uncharacterized protein LOC107427220 [Ziziphus jujuba]|uniref:Uncharacterized protein LOC107427220 n=1 Tax=Ziziphus jujuba TaxID=326968 RepID=A0A6P4AV93_ZIZJJ|nr:uncharacterized protein LOC107427220 [Ziziphus jujuba]
MDQRKLMAYIIIRTWHLHMMGLFLMMMLWMIRRKRNRRRHTRRYLLRNRTFDRHETRLSYLDNIIGNSDVECINQLGMDRRTFGILCELLHTDGRVKNDGLVRLEEQVCIFLHILTHHVKNRTINSRFKRSGETISRYFNSVLHGVLRLHGRLLLVPEPVSDNCTDDRWKCFKNCLGALNGTYIKVRVFESDKPRYRTGNGEIATNVLGVCSRDMKFIFVLPGWEGSASDSIVLQDAITRPNGFKVPTGMDIEQNTQLKGTRRSWNKIEEEALLTILEDVVSRGGKCDNGSFKPGTINQIEKALQESCPNSGLKATPHIDSKMRKWKKYYGLICDMMNRSGFVWNDVRKCIEVDSEEAWLTYVQHNKDARGWRGKPFPIFDRLANILGKDRATGRGAETPVEMAKELDREEENMKENMNDGDESSPVSVHNQNRSTATSSHTKKRNRSADNIDDIAMASFQQMFEKSIEHLSVITEKLVKGNEDRSDISAELSTMGLSEDDHLDVFQTIIDKPQYVSTFKSLKGDLKERFVKKLLKQIRGD